MPDIDVENATTELFGPPPVGFDVVERVAVGPRSEVWCLRRLEDGKLFAWKRLRPELIDDQQSREAVEREAAALESVGNSFVVALERDLTRESPPAVLLAWLEGHSLEREWQGGQRLPVSRAVWYARQIAQGLQALESAGFAHGALTPAHVFLTTDRKIRLLGLGDAILLGKPSHPASRPVVKGTVEYLAPEALLQGAFDPVAGDVYSLGVLLFRMLSGRLPFSGENAGDVLRLHRQAPPPPLEKYCPQLSADEIGLVSLMLRKHPLRRPRLAEVLAGLLEWELRWFGLSASA